jgi:hypothetical protein
MSDIQALLYQLRQIDVHVQPKQRLREIYGTVGHKISRKRPRDQKDRETVCDKKKVWRPEELEESKESHVDDGTRVYEKNS